MGQKLAPGHDNALQPAPSASTMSIYSIMPAGGGLYSTANDLLTFLSQCVGCQPSPLAPAMKTALSVRRPVKPGNHQALGWNIYGKDSDQLIFRDGSSFGYASAIAHDFFATELPVRVTFQTGPDGKVRSLTIYPPRGQKGVPADKLATER
jgi:hypothetical protein